ncbi:MAG: endonuclease V [Thermoproteales archaeon]|nr:endonuclease V [Thermoproteales archaeon]
MEEVCSTFKTVAGADAAFAGGKAYGAVTVFSFPELELVEAATACRQISFPYIPGLLSFREGPVLLDCFAQLEIEPDVIIFDGHGIAHPRGLGLASHLGLVLNLPSVGCAKNKLLSSAEEPALRRGSWKPLIDKRGRETGCILRTRDNVKPVFVSPGHRMGLKGSRDLVLACATRFRIPEPLRRAHQLATAAAKGDKLAENRLAPILKSLNPGPR